MALNGSKYSEELWIGIKADYASLQQGLKISQNEIKSFVGHIQSSSQQLKKFGRTTTMVSGAVVALGAVVTTVFAKFEQSMANTASVIGANREELDSLSNTAREMGETTIFSASQAADAMYYLASAGFSAQQIMASLKGTLDLAAATQYDLSETTRIVVSTLNAFGLAASDAGRIANVFSAVISGSQATMKRIGDSMKYVAPIAAQLGISVEQTAAALGILYNSGLEASQAGTYLRGGLQRLQAPTKQAMKAFKDLGLSFNDVNPQMNSLVDIIDAFKKAGAGAIDKGDELSKIFGIRAVSAFQILIKAGAEELENLETQITNTDKASEMAKTQIDTFSGSMKLLKSVMQEAAIQIGEALQPIIRGLVDFLRDAFALFNALPSSIKTITATAIALAAGMGLIVGPAALLIAQLPTLITMVSGLGVSFQVALGWVGLAAAAIIGITMAIGGYVKAKTDANKAEAESQKQFSKQQAKLGLLSRRYLKLKKTVNRTATEQKLYLDTIKKLQIKYPNYLKNINLEKISYENASIAIFHAGEELKKYLKLKIAQGVVEDENKKYIAIGEDIIDIQTKITDNQAKMDELSLTSAGNDLAFFNIKNLELANSIMTTTMDGLKKKQDDIFENIQRKTKLAEKLINGIPPVTPRNGGKQDCPEGYHWDAGKKMCVPDVTEIKNDAAEALQAEMLEIKSRGLKSELELLRVNKDESFELEKEYLIAKQGYELKSLGDWEKIERSKLIKLGATQSDMEVLTESYLKRLAIMEDKHRQEQLALDKKIIQARQQEIGNKAEFESRFDKDVGYGEDYALKLEEYMEFLKQQLSLTNEWSDEYLNILSQIDGVKNEMIENEMQRNRLLFLSLSDGANLALASITGAFNAMWNSYIMPKSREAANELDAIWMTIRDSALRAMQQILQDAITKLLLKTIAQIVGFALGGAPGAAVGSAVAGAGSDFVSPSNYGGVGMVPAAATGASVTKSGSLRVHAGEVIVPANIVRSNKKDYQNAAGDNGNNTVEPIINNNISLVLNNPVVNDNNYWDTVLEEYINPAVDRIKKRM